jgi:hypothetical protein
MVSRANDCNFDIRHCQSLTRHFLVFQSCQERIFRRRQCSSVSCARTRSRAHGTWWFTCRRLIWWTSTNWAFRSQTLQSRGNTPHNKPHPQHRLAPVPYTIKKWWVQPQLQAALVTHTFLIHCFVSVSISYPQLGGGHCACSVARSTSQIRLT